MPYIKEENRLNLDRVIEDVVLRLKVSAGIKLVYSENLTNEQLLAIAGDINYCFSRICMSVMGDVSYSKIAVTTGVLENVKQELYRRAATNYEDKKIIENGDIKEYQCMT
jgi:hypothetical protein